MQLAYHILFADYQFLHVPLQHPYFHGQLSRTVTTVSWIYVLNSALPAFSGTGSSKAAENDPFFSVLHIEAWATASAVFVHFFLTIEYQP